MSKYTKGPWEISKDKNSSILVGSNNCPVLRIDKGLRGLQIAFVFTNGELSDPIVKANAHLISAAPELLEACKLLTSELVNGQNVPSLGCMEKVKQAIAKAEGKV